MPDAIQQKCECGCGKRARPCRRFVRGHNKRTPGGGRYVGTSGYVFVSMPEHPRANAYGYVREHILVAERALGRPLPDGAVVHHVNRDRADNRPANLVICEDATYHMLLHTRMETQERCGDPSARLCSHCGKRGTPESLEPKGKATWAHTACRRRADARRSRELAWRRGDNVPHVSVPADTVSQMVDLYRSGLSTRAIGKRVGWSASTVKTRLDAEGVRMRGRGGSRGKS